MKGFLKLINFFITTVDSDLNGNPTGIIVIKDKTVDGYTLVDGEYTFFVIVNLPNKNSREIFRVWKVEGNELHYDKRISPSGTHTHEKGTMIQINDVSEVLNYISKNIDNFGYVEHKINNVIKIYGGKAKYNDTYINVPNKEFTLSNGTHNIGLSYLTGTFEIIDGTFLGTTIATVVASGGEITTITDNRHNELNTYFDGAFFEYNSNRLTIKDLSITTSKINDGAITNDKLGNNSVSTDKIQDDAVTTDKISDSNVTTSKINNSAITYNKMAPNSVGTINYLNGSISNDKIINGAISEIKFHAAVVEKLRKANLIKDNGTGSKILTDDGIYKEFEFLEGILVEVSGLSDNDILFFDNTSHTIKGLDLTDFISNWTTDNFESKYSEFVGSLNETTTITPTDEFILKTENGIEKISHKIISNNIFQGELGETLDNNFHYVKYGDESLGQDINKIYKTNINLDPIGLINKGGEGVTCNKYINISNNVSVFGNNIYGAVFTSSLSSISGIELLEGKSKGTGNFNIKMFPYGSSLDINNEILSQNIEFENYNGIYLNTQITFNTNSNSSIFTNIPGLTDITINQSGLLKVNLNYRYTASSGNGETIRFRILVNGIQVFITNDSFEVGSTDYNKHLSTTINSGDIVTVQFRVNNSNRQYRFNIREIEPFESNLDQIVIPSINVIKGNKYGFIVECNTGDNLNQIILKEGSTGIGKIFSTNGLVEGLTEGQGNIGYILNSNDKGDIVNFYDSGKIIFDNINLNIGQYYSLNGVNLGYATQSNEILFNNNINYINKYTDHVIVPSEDIMTSSNGPVNLHPVGVWNLVKQATCKKTGIYRIKFTLYAQGGSNQGSGSGRIYKNGVPYGIERSFNSYGASQTYTEDLEFLNGDYIQIYGRLNGQISNINSFQVCGSNVLTSTRPIINL